MKEKDLVRYEGNLSEVTSKLVPIGRVPVFSLEKKDVYISLSATLDIAIHNEKTHINEKMCLNSKDKMYKDISELIHAGSGDLDFFVFNEKGRAHFLMDKMLKKSIASEDFELFSNSPKEPYLSSDCIIDVAYILYTGYATRNCFFSAASLLRCFKIKNFTEEKGEEVVETKINEKKYSALRELSKKYSSLGDKEASLRVMKEACRHLGISENSL